MTPKHDDHLWAGAWRHRHTPEETPAQAGEAAPEPTPDPAPARDARRDRSAAVRRRRRAAAGGAAAIAVAAFGAGALIGGGEDEGGAPATASSALPAAASASSTAKSGTVAAVYEKAADAVVSIRTGGGQGTGFLVDEDGTLVTNAHVVGGASTVQVQFGEDGRRVTGRVMGSDPSTDLAVVKIDASAATGVEPLELADERGLKVGDTVVAIGNPLGLDRTATAGIVSALGRSIEAPNGFSISDAIQTDAPINSGNSGGPLLDAAGRVVGVNSQIATSGAGSGNIGIGFAVPSTKLQEILPALRTGGEIRHAFLGVSTGEVAGGGAEIAQVTPGGPADRAGLRAGDVITRIGGTAVGDPDDVGEVVEGHDPGDTIEVTVRRGGDERTVDVELGTRPSQAARQVGP